MLWDALFGPEPTKEEVEGHSQLLGSKNPHLGSFGMIWDGLFGSEPTEKKQESTQRSFPPAGFQNLTFGMLWDALGSFGMVYPDLTPPEQSSSHLPDAKTPRLGSFGMVYPELSPWSRAVPTCCIPKPHLWDGFGWFGILWDGLGWFGILWDGLSGAQPPEQFPPAGFQNPTFGILWDPLGWFGVV